MNIFSYVYSLFSIFSKEGDKIYHIGSNKCLEFIAIWPFICVTEENYLSGVSFSIEVSFLLKYENYAMKSSSFATFLNYKVARSDWTSPFIPPRWVLGKII